MEVWIPFRQEILILLNVIYTYRIQMEPSRNQRLVYIINNYERTRSIQNKYVICFFLCF